MKGLHFNFKDLFRAARIGFSLQRIWVNSIGLFAAYLVYFVFSYISVLAGGYGFAEVWVRFGLLPCGYSLALPWYGILINLFGSFLSLAVIFLTNTAVSRVVYMVMRNELFYTWSQAYKFALKKWISILGTYLTFILMIVFFVIAALVMGLIGRIPFVGELGTTILTLPYILTALLLFFISLVFGVALFIAPAVIATSDEDALGGVFQSFSVTFNQPWRLLVYGAIVSVLELVGIFLFAAALKVSYNIFIDLFSIGMGEKILEINNHALSLIDKALPALYGWIHSLPGDMGNWIYLVHHHAATSVPGTYAVSSYIFAIFLLLLGGTVLAYGEAVGNAGVTIIYIILYKLHEKENLLEREDEELKEEEEETTPENEQKESEGKDNPAAGGSESQDEESPEK